MTDADYNYLFRWGLTAAGGFLLCLWGTVLLLLEKREEKRSLKDSPR